MPTAGVVIDASDWTGGITSGTAIAEMRAAGVGLFLVRAGYAAVQDNNWANHKAKLLAEGTSIVPGAFWTVERSEQGVQAPSPGYFYPPFPEGHTWRSSTYSGHSDFSVDFNWGSPGEDEGSWIVAPSPGTVRYRHYRPIGANGPSDPGVSDLLIEHVGRYQSLYTHMKNMQVGLGDHVRLGQRLGQVSTVGNASGSHLHHKHYFRRQGDGGTFGDPIKMRIKGVAMESSVWNSDTGIVPVDKRNGQNVRGETVDVETYPEYTAAQQAEMFLAALGDPTGWFCAVHVDAVATTNQGLSPWWAQVKGFADAFWASAPGHPLYIFTRRNYWTQTIEGHAGHAVDTKAAGFRGLITQDTTQNSAINITSFTAAANALAYNNGGTVVHAGNYAGWTNSKLLRFGNLTVGSRVLPGLSYPGTLNDLKLASGLIQPDPDPDPGPNPEPLPDPDPFPDPDPGPLPVVPPGPDPAKEVLVPWAEQWTILVDGLDLNDHKRYATTVPELQGIAPGRVVLADIDGDYPAMVRRQPAAGPLTFLIAMKGAFKATDWDERYRELVFTFSPDTHHVLTAQVRGMGTRKTMRFMVESMQPDYRTRTCVVYATAAKPVLV